MNNQIDERRLNELDQEVSNYLETELRSKAIPNLSKQTRNNNKANNDNYLETGYSMNRISTYPSNNEQANQSPRGLNSNNLYDHLLVLKEKVNNLEDVNHELSLQNQDFELKSKKLIEIESTNKTLKEDNNKLCKRIEDYQRQNKEWEQKVEEIKARFILLEAENKSLREESDESKRKFEDTEFKLKLLSEKEKSHENSVNNLKEVQKNYENSLIESKREYKAKEDSLKKKYEGLEKEIKKQIDSSKKDHDEKFERLEYYIKDQESTIKRLEKENSNLIDKQTSNEKFFKAKEIEFEELTEMKDRKLKELEKSINSISEEAQSQIHKLNQTLSELNDRINIYQNQETQLLNENAFLQSKTEELNEKLNSVEKKFEQTERKELNSHRSGSRSILSGINTGNSNDFQFEKLKQRIKEKESLIINLEREIEEMRNENLSKDENYEKITSDLKRNLYKTDNSLQQSEYKLQKCVADYESLITKHNGLIKTYTGMKDSYDSLRKAVDEMSQEIKFKDNESSKMKKNYERIIYDLQNKMEELLLKDQISTKKFAPQTTRNTPKPNRIMNISARQDNSDYGFSPRKLPDDEEIRRKINDQINYIRSKLEKK